MAAPSRKQEALILAAESLELREVQARVAKENPTWDVGMLEAVMREYRRWLVLCSLPHSGQLGMCSPAVDEAWHAHILFTKTYMRHCEALAGRYIHHEPTSAEEKAEGDRTSSLRTLATYEAVFGEKPPGLWYPSRSGSGAVKMGADCDECAARSCQPHECTTGDCNKPNCTDNCKSTGCGES